MDNVETTATTNSTQTLGALRGRTYELTTFRGGKVELYEEYSDIPGLRQFVGYVEDILSHMPATMVRDLAPLFKAHHEAHAAFWGTYLPGAEKWLH